MTLSDSIQEHLAANEGKIADIAQAIWERPEASLQEEFASAALAVELERAEFAVRRGAGGMATAFVAEWGRGKPVIGVLGEYDALPGLSQKAIPVHEAVCAGGPGHGCGHNLVGAGALGAALAVKAAMERHRLPGTVRYYGCPAEETLTGKVYMARDGVFDDLDAALTWHPDVINSTWSSGISSAMNSFKVNFTGVASHAAVAPELGRSALDAAILMDVGVNYLREHVSPDARMHSVVTQGGNQPNIVPPHAQIWWYVRHPQRSQVEAIYRRMLDIARGAALMTGTSCEIDFVTGCHSMLPNQALSRRLLERFEGVGVPRFSREEHGFAAALQASHSADVLEANVEEILKTSSRKIARSELGLVLCERIIPPAETFRIMPGSTDVGDVSHIAPTAVLLVTCAPVGTAVHTWPWCAACGSPMGFRGMLSAARVLAVVALDLLTDPDLVRRAREEFAEATREAKYVSPLPAGARAC